MIESLPAFYEWFQERYRRNAYQVTRTALEHLHGWSVDPETGDVCHQSGKFFAIRGLEVETDHRPTGTWTQPIIVQPEIGILGIVARRVDGVVHCLIQAKMEPGNVNLLQLSPTVQATRSNYMRVHGGSKVPYLDHFVAPRGGRIVHDSLQSEQGSWFLAKRNRNMIVEVDHDLPEHEDYVWLSLDLLGELMRVPNLVNMDARTVLSGIPLMQRDVADLTDPGGLHTVEQLVSWFTEVKSRYRLTQRLVPLNRVPSWRRDGDALVHEGGRYFRVIGVDVQATNREVAKWAQPLFAPTSPGVIGFLGRHINGVFHVLVHAKTEAGTHDVVEMGPTLSCAPANYVGTSQQPRYLDHFTGVRSDQVLVDVVHSEEGGRFYHAENRYIVVDAGEDFGIDVPDDYCWMTPAQLTGFVRHGNYVNVAARCLLSCLVSEQRALVRTEAA